VWICADPHAHGHKGHYPTRQAGQAAQPDGDAGDQASAAADAAAKRARAERRLVIENNRAWRSAETVRRTWLAGLLARKAPPAGALRFILTEIAAAHWTLCSSLGQGHQLAAQLLGLDGKHAITDALAAAADGRAQVITLALILGAYEEHTSTDTWRTPKDSDRHYLTALTGWGYQPSDIENHVINPTAT
jgi:ParB family chromosome partitioning protein